MTVKKLPFRWVVLLLTVLVNLFVAGMNQSCMPSLYGEIIKDIPMTHAQWGTVWGIGSIAAMAFTLIGGMSADWLGIRFVIGIATIFTGIFGIGRALTSNFLQLAVVMFCMGISNSFMMPNLTKSLGHWFPSSELGLANGILIAGVCVGSGSALMLSGVYLSPLMGGWRRLLWLYGLISIIIGIFWLCIMREGQSSSHNPKEEFSFRKALSVVIRIKDMWLLMASRFCIFGALLAVIGFLPELLVSKGMRPNLAHLSSSLIYYANIIGVIAIPILSDRFGLRKIFIWPFSLLSAFLIVVLGLLDGIASLALCALIGLLVGFIPLLMALPMEMEGIGHSYFGTSIGLATGLGTLGSFVAPAIGGKIIDATGKEWCAFVFWGLLMAIGALFILPMKETGSKIKALSVIENPME